jgi:hypothetical protein
VFAAVKIQRAAEAKRNAAQAGEAARNANKRTRYARWQWFHLVVTILISLAALAVVVLK